MAIIPQFDTRQLIEKPFTTAKKHLATQQIVVFPDELREQPGVYPFVSFTRQARPGAGPSRATRTIHLPMVPGLTFDDKASYEAVDTGIQGAGFDGLMDLISSGSWEQFLDKLRDGGKTALTPESLMVLGQKIGSSAMSAKIREVTGVAEQTNTINAFNKNNLRDFTFDYKLVAKTETEQRSIRDLVQIFREGTYGDAETQNIHIAVPPKWNIAFTFGGAHNPWIPNIRDCYLTSVSTKFNSDNNLWRRDGSPIDVTISLSFTETKVLRLHDIAADLTAAYMPQPVSREPRTIISALTAPFRKNK